MSKLKKLLQDQADRQNELKALKKFLDQVQGNGMLIMQAVSSTESNNIAFTPADIGLELKVLDPLIQYEHERSKELAEIDARINALETLV